MESKQIHKHLTEMKYTDVKKLIELLHAANYGDALKLAEYIDDRLLSIMNEIYLTDPWPSEYERK